MRLCIRDAAPDDLEPLSGLKPTRALHRDRMAAALGGRIRYLVAETAGEVVGFVVVALSQPRGREKLPNTPFLIDLFVAPARRGRGIGTEILEYAEALARAQGFDALYLGVEPYRNPRALGLYRRRGFLPLQERPYRNPFHFIDSEGHVHQGDEWLVDMKKPLGPDPSPRR